MKRTQFEFTHLQLPVAPHPRRLSRSRHIPPPQHGCEDEHVWPIDGHVVGWQLPLVIPVGMTQPKPEQQSAEAVQLAPWVEQVVGVWQSDAPPSREKQTPEQHSDAAVHTVLLDLQLPASVVSWHEVPSLDTRQKVPVQHAAFAPPSPEAPQGLPSVAQVALLAQTNAPPSVAGRQGAPPQH